MGNIWVSPKAPNDHEMGASLWVREFKFFASKLSPLLQLTKSISQVITNPRPSHKNLTEFNLQGWRCMYLFCFKKKKEIPVNSNNQRELNSSFFGGMQAWQPPYHSCISIEVRFLVKPYSSFTSSSILVLEEPCGSIPCVLLEYIYARRGSAREI